MVVRSKKSAMSLPIINYSGGTEISGGIIGCFTIMPLKPASFSGPFPGSRPMLWTTPGIRSAAKSASSSSATPGRG